MAKPANARSPKSSLNEELIVIATNEELIVIAKSLKLNKTPDLDGTPTVVIKAAIEASPDMFRMVMHMCLDRGEFPERWKGKDGFYCPNTGSQLASCQHTDLTVGTDHSVEADGLLVYTEKPDDSGLSDYQFGFR